MAQAANTGMQTVTAAATAENNQSATASTHELKQKKAGLTKKYCHAVFVTKFRTT